MLLASKIEFLADAASEDADIYASDYQSSQAFEAELRLVLDGTEVDEVLTISMLESFTGRFAAPGAVDVVCKVLEERGDGPRIRILVQSESVAKKLAPRLDRSACTPREVRFGELTLEVVLGDITEVDADAIVNASNTRLVLGSGVSGAIRRRAHAGLQDALNAIARQTTLLPGDVVVTNAYGLLHTRKIFHAATASGGGKAVRRALENCLTLAAEHQLQTLAMPALGTGTGGMAMEDFAELLLEYLSQPVEPAGQRSLDRILIVLWTVADFEILTETLGK